MGFFGVGLKTYFGSTHVVKHLLFSMFSSTLTFDFDLILGSLGGLMGYFWGRSIDCFLCTTAIDNYCTDYCN